MKAMKTHILNKIERLRQETPLPESNNTLEFEDDYKDDAFDSAENKSDQVSRKSLEEEQE